MQSRVESEVLAEREAQLAELTEMNRAKAQEREADVRTADLHARSRSREKGQVLLNKKLVGQMERVLESTNMRVPKGRAKEIINEILDQGRLEFLRARHSRGKSDGGSRRMPLQQKIVYTAMELADRRGAASRLRSETDDTGSENRGSAKAGRLIQKAKLGGAKEERTVLPEIQTQRDPRRTLLLEKSQKGKRLRT